jgi:hypothetical protein
MFAAMRRASRASSGALPSPARLVRASRWAGLNRAPDARAEHCYCRQGLVSRRSLQRFIGDFVEDIFLDPIGGKGGAVVHYPSSLSQCCNSSGSFAMLAAMRRASSRVSRCAAARRPRLLLEVHVGQRVAVGSWTMKQSCVPLDGAGAARNDLRVGARRCASRGRVRSAPGASLFPGASRVLP